MRSIKHLIETMHAAPCHVFEAECAAWADDAGNDAENQIWDFLTSGGERMEALSVLSAVQRACECDLGIIVPEPIQEVQPDGSIRCVTPMAELTEFFPAKHANLEEIFAELRTA